MRAGVSSITACRSALCVRTIPRVCGRGGVFQTLGSANGAIINIPGAPVIYHMGDTDIFAGMGLDRGIAQARYRDCADRRPLHHGAVDGGSGGAAVLPALEGGDSAAISALSVRSPAPLEEFKRELGPMGTRLLDLHVHEPMIFSIG